MNKNTLEKSASLIKTEKSSNIEHNKILTINNKLEIINSKYLIIKDKINKLWNKVY
jgi:hypothetical protein